jgi:hypothetical protein
MPIISATWWAEMGKITVRSQRRQKVDKFLSQQQQKLGMALHACYPSYMRDVRRRIKVQTTPGKNVRPYLRNN